MKPTKGIAVDGYCSGNPGNGGYRGVDIETGEILFKNNIGHCTNNIAEFLGICHGLGYVKKINTSYNVVYSDSEIAIAWVKAKKCSTNLNLANLDDLRRMIKKSEMFLLERKSISIGVIKWLTKEWGEIPADFGNKK